MSPDSCVRVLSVGGSLIVGPMSPDSLVRMATAAANGGGHLTVKGQLSPDSMVRIASTAPGHITFDLT